MFTVPGFLKALAPGMVEVTTMYNWSRPGTDPVKVPGNPRRAFTVAPGMTSEEMVDLEVQVREATAPFSWLPGATIDIAPDRGANQSCISSGPIGSCHFWVFAGTVKARVTKSGYQQAEGSAPPPPAGFNGQVLMLTMMRVS
jgi:hypothetical protein